MIQERLIHIQKLNMAWRHLRRSHKFLCVYGVISFCFLFALLHSNNANWFCSNVVSIDINSTTAKCLTNSVTGSKRLNFQTVSISQTTLYVYPALPGEENLRFIVLKKRDVDVKGLHCALWYPPNMIRNHWMATTAKALVTDLKDHHNLEYTATFIVCPLQEQQPLVSCRDIEGDCFQKDLVTPESVSLVTSLDTLHEPMAKFPITSKVSCQHVSPTSTEKSFKASSTESKVITSEYVETKSVQNEAKRVDFTVCVPNPLGASNTANQVIEKIEMSRTLGAGRVVFYIHNITSNVDVALKMFMRERAEDREPLEIIAHFWHLPTFLSVDKLYKLGQVALINDCLHRYRQWTSFTIFTDLNEHIVPREHTNWQQLIQSLKNSKPDASVFSFRSAIFRKEWPSPATGLQSSAMRYDSSILLFTKREGCLLPTEMGTRMIVDPTMVEEAGMNSAWTLTGKVYNVLEKEGLVCRYGSASSKQVFKDDTWKTCDSPVVDTYTVEKFGKQLVAGLKMVWSKLSGAVTVAQRKDNTRQEEDSIKKGDISHFTFPVKQNSFRLVEGLGSPLFVYSALWRGDNVRLVSLKRQNIAISDLYCEFFQDSIRFIEKAVVKDFNQFKAPYTGASVVCPVKSESYKESLPMMVGLFREGNRSSAPSVKFVVEGRNYQTGIMKRTGNDSASYRKDEVELTVCIPAMFSYSNAAQLVQKIEMSRLLGAGRIVFYNHSISSNVDAVLRMYAKEWMNGKETLEVVVHQWRLPSYSGKTVSVPYYAQLASIDDCLHRYRWTTQYTEFSDMDEFLVPLQSKNNSQLFAKRDKETANKVIAGYMFRCAVFNNDLPLSAKGFDKEAMQYGSTVLGLTQRDTYIYKKGVRSKLIVKPKLVEEMGVHFIWHASGVTDVMPLESGLLYHYRSPINKCANQTMDTRVADKYGESLALRLQKIWAKLPGVSLGWKPPERRKQIKCE